MMNNLKIHSLYIELLSRCNLSCPYCYNDSDISRETELDYLKIQEAISAAKECSAEIVYLSGGEPTLYSKLFELIKYIESLNLKVCVITNCTKIDDRIIEQTNCLFQVTLDGANKETHGASRGRQNYEQVLEFISKLDSRDMNHRIHLRYNVTTKNYVEIPKLLNMASDYGISDVYFGAIISTGRGIANYTDFGIYGKHEMTINIQNLLKEMKNRYIDKINISYPEPSLSFGCILYQTEPSLTIKIDSHGYIYPCSLFTERRFSVGNIYQDSLVNSQIYKGIYSIVQQAITKRAENNRCQKCICQELCKGGCVALFLEDGCASEFEDMCVVRQKEYNKLFSNVRKITKKEEDE